MTYDTGDALQSLSRTFVHPRLTLAPVLFWVWNGELDADRIRAQLDDIHRQGFGGVSPIPMGENFRLSDFLVGISPPYLSDEFFELVKVAVSKAASLGLQVWLYDEGGWPSGSAQGKVVQGHPELRARTITCRRADRADLPSRADNLVALCAVTPDGEVKVVQSPTDLPSSVAHLLAFEERIFDDGYPDLMNPAAVDRFIQLTHERYASYVGEYFGNVIPGFFTDEPRVRGTVAGREAPWSPALRQHLDEAFGSRWLTWLPALFGQEALGFDPFDVLGEPAVVEARCDYFQAVSAQFEESYWRKLNDWCERHGLIHTGHVGGEDNLPDHVNGGFFHWFRTAGALHAPGVDVIWRQLMPGQRNSPFPLLAASALHARPGGAAPPTDPERQDIAVSESYAVYGYGATFAQYAWVANYQFVRGINRIWPLGYYYSTVGGRAYGTMSHIGPGNPLWAHWEGFNRYLARMSSLVAHTGHACDIALYYPIEAQWAYHGRAEAARAWESMWSACDALHQAQMAFDILDTQSLVEAEVSERCIETQGQFYSTVIVPDCTVIPAAVMTKLWQMHEAGGRVVFLGDVPKLADRVAEQGEMEELAGAFLREAFVLDEQAEREQWGTASGRMTEAATGSVLDGLSAALLGPAGREVYAPQSLKPDAVLLASDDEWPRLAQLMATTVGRYVIEPLQIEPNLRISSRWLTEDTWVHLLFNEGRDEMTVRLGAISDCPLVIEQWNLFTGAQNVTAYHEEKAELTPFELTLFPGEMAVLVTTPSATPPPRPSRRQKKLVLSVFDKADETLVTRECLIENGTMKVAEQLSPLASSGLGRWSEAGLQHFAGTVRYRFIFALAEAYVDADVFLDLGDVEYAATVYVNGQEAGHALWPPYRVPLRGVLKAGHNELLVEVSNTLAAQVLRGENLQQAEEHGWNNAYYQRCLSWHRESLGGGLIGPVAIVALVP